MDDSQRISPKDIFLDIWTVITLYVSAGFFISLLFDFVNYFLPDVANPSFPSDAVRWPVAILITIFPTHVIAQWLLQKEYIVAPEKRERRLHKWLLYLTLFLTAIAIVVDLAFLVYNFLGGELSAQFLLKVLSVAVVAGGVFSYYILDLRRESVKLTFGSVLLLRGIIAFVALAVIGAFFIAGSPFRQRDAKIDAQRINHLQMIQDQIVHSYWQSKGSLPPSLGALRDDISGFVAPNDPQTSQPYEYRTTGALSFELCANFITSSASGVSGYSGPVYNKPIGPYGFDNWQHVAGRACFERTIDPLLYKTQGVIPPGEQIPVRAVQ